MKYSQLAKTKEERTEDNLRHIPLYINFHKRSFESNHDRATKIKLRHIKQKIQYILGSSFCAYQLIGHKTNTCQKEKKKYYHLQKKLNRIIQQWLHITQ